jgi:hypothetical protein
MFPRVVQHKKHTKIRETRNSATRHLSTGNTGVKRYRKHERNIRNIRKHQKHGLNMAELWKSKNQLIQIMIRPEIRMRMFNAASVNRHLSCVVPTCCLSMGSLRSRNGIIQIILRQLLHRSSCSSYFIDIIVLFKIVVD